MIVSKGIPLPMLVCDYVPVHAKNSYNDQPAVATHGTTGSCQWYIYPDKYVLLLIPPPLFFQVITIAVAQSSSSLRYTMQMFLEKLAGILQGGSRFDAYVHVFCHGSIIGSLILTSAHLRSQSLLYTFLQTYGIDAANGSTLTHTGIFLDGILTGLLAVIGVELVIAA